MKPYQFATLRYIHNVGAAEFVNVGVVMWCPADGRFLYELNDRYGRLSGFFKSGFDGASFRSGLRLLRSKLERLASQHSGQTLFDRDKELQAYLDWVLPEDSSCFQWSEVMAGIASDLNGRLNQLFAELVERHEARGARQRRDEMEVWTGQGLLARIDTQVEVKAPSFSYQFRAGWMNGVQQVLEPISLDYLAKSEVIDKANSWCGRLLNLSKSEHAFQFTAVVSKPDRPELQATFEQALRMLREAPQVRRILQEEEVPEFLPLIEKDLAGHSS
jgi:hypothetical protein